MDQPFVWGLVLKPVIGVVILVVVFLVPILLVKLLRPMFPEGKIKDVLFRERPSNPDASGLADSEQRILDDTTFIGRETGKDSARL